MPLQGNLLLVREIERDSIVDDPGKPSKSLSRKIE